MLKMIFMENLDLVIAGSMILVGLVVLVLSRLKLMPSKGRPFIIGAIIGIIGLTIFNRAKAKQLKKDVVQLEKQIADRQKEIQAGTQDLQKQDEILAQAKQEYEQSLKNYKRSAVSYQIKDREQYDAMSDDEIFDEFDRIGSK